MTVAHVADDTLSAIGAAVKQLVQGSVQVIDAHARRDWDREEGDEQVWLEVTLADPVGDTWPAAEMTALSQRVRQVGFDRGLDMVVTYTNPTHGTDDPDAPGEGEFRPDTDG